MELPTVKSCFCLNLRTFGVMFGFFQLFIYVVALLINIFFRGHLLIPIICEFVCYDFDLEKKWCSKMFIISFILVIHIIVMPIGMGISWICGIQKVCILNIKHFDDQRFFEIILTKFSNIEKTNADVTRNDSVCDRFVAMCLFHCRLSDWCCFPCTRYCPFPQGLYGLRNVQF